MSARALQRVAVRMLFDPALVEAVYAGAEAALAEVDLGADERAWLTAPDRRRWLADPLRRTRGLRALLEEFPVAAALAGVHRLDAFFSSEAFHACIQGRGSLAATFGAWLQTTFDAARAAACLETAAAEVLRAPPRGPVEVFTVAARWRTAPWVRPLTLPAGTLAAHHAVHTRLAAHEGGPVAALLHVRQLEADPPRTNAAEGLLVERGDASASVGEAPAPLVALLQRLREAHAGEAVLEALCALGADDRAEALELAAELVGDGLLASPGNDGS